MKRISFSSLGISLFCSCVLSNAAYDVARGPILASPIAAQSVERSLQEMALRMGGEGAEVPVAVAAAAGKPAGVVTPPLEPLAEWLLKNGTSIAFSSNVSGKFKLSDGKKLPVRQKAYSDDNGLYTASISTENNRTAIIFSIEPKDEPKTIYFFLTGLGGEIEATAYAQRPDVYIVENTKYSDLFEKRKKYWIEKVEAIKKAEAQALAKADPSKAKS